MVAIFNPESSIRDNWKAAYPLNDAWFLCASDDFQEQYRNAGSNAALTASLIVMMQKDLQFRIGNDEFIAIGIQIAPKHTSEPTIISDTFFGSDSAQIDFEQSKLSALNLQFMDVRVCLYPIADNQELSIDKSTGETNQKRGGGRTSLYPEIRKILNELFNEKPALQSLSAAKLIDAVNNRYKVTFHSNDIRLSPISERSLREYLKRYRQELADTGEK